MKTESISQEEDINLSSAMSYADFYKLTEWKAMNPDPSDEKASLYPLNLQRLKRVEKTTVLPTQLLDNLKKLNRKLNWTILAEPWCGDGAQIMPILTKIANESDKIELQILLRDQNPDVMDKFLTNGTRSIPKLICYDEKTGKLMGTWGPRPQVLVKEIEQYKKENPGYVKDELLQFIHTWYARDKGQQVLTEINAFIEGLTN